MNIKIVGVILISLGVIFITVISSQDSVVCEKTDKVKTILLGKLFFKQYQYVCNGRHVWRYQ